MTERAFLVAFLYMVFSFGFGVLMGKYIKWRNRGQ